MSDNKKYFIEILKNALKWSIVPNILLSILWKFDTEFTFIPILTIVFNSLILPFSLLISTKSINEKFEKNWWHLNSIIFSILLISSIFFNLMNWILSVEKNNGFYGRHNIDSGTWMLIKLELLIGFGILIIGLFYYSTIRFFKPKF